MIDMTMETAPEARSHPPTDGVPTPKSTKLTDAAARGAKKGVTARDLADGTVPGLSLRVLPSGRKAWALRVRVQGRPVRVDLGEFPKTSLAEARQIAQDARKLAGRGENPEHAVRPPIANMGATVA
ncbi:MAG: integrase, partial [Rhodopila sp.]|nr:integrase [Rhodopila sp.]